MTNNTLQTLASHRSGTAAVRLVPGLPGVQTAAAAQQLTSQMSSLPTVYTHPGDPALGTPDTAYISFTIDSHACSAPSSNQQPAAAVDGARATPAQANFAQLADVSSSTTVQHPQQASAVPTMQPLKQELQQQVSPATAPTPLPMPLPTSVPSASLDPYSAPALLSSMLCSAASTQPPPAHPLDLDMDVLLRDWPHDFCIAPSSETLLALKEAGAAHSGPPSLQLLEGLLLTDVTQEQLIYVLCHCNHQASRQILDAMVVQHPALAERLASATLPNGGAISTAAAARTSSAGTPVHDAEQPAAASTFQQDTLQQCKDVSTAIAQESQQNRQQHNAVYLEAPPWGSEKDEFREWATRVGRDVVARRTGDCAAAKVSSTYTVYVVFNGIHAHAERNRLCVFGWL
jgi:hypothetical protein